MEKDDSFDPSFMEDVLPPKQDKYPQYKKAERPKSSFID